ncbi:MAG: KH domain-containing protein [Firmicutes bacterium]|nr:KH domain-containing protein [Bacillota bacterium]
MPEYKGSTTEEAKKKGLSALGITESEADIEITSYGGLLSKASVLITPKAGANAVEVSKKAESKEESPESAQEKPRAKKRASEPKEADSAEENSDSEEKRVFPTEVLEKVGGEALEFLREVLCKMYMSHCDTEFKIKDGEILLEISGDDAGSLIGHRGETLDAIRHIVSTVTTNGEKTMPRVQVDAARYRERRVETLTALANRMARKAASSRTSVELEPMNPYDRRTIHSALTEDRFVKTESRGEGKFRHVVIIPVDRGGRNRDRGGRRDNRERDRDNREGGFRSEYTPKSDFAPKRDTVSENINNESAPREITYGSSDFSKRGPNKIRSFGQKGRKF